MKHGIFYAFWEKEWAADYCYYVNKAAKLNFDILEIGVGPLPDYSKEQIKALGECAKNAGIQLTAGYGPTYNHNMGSSDMKIRQEALEWYKRLFEVMEQLDMHALGGAIYGYWPVDFTNTNKEEDWKYAVEGMQILAPEAKKHDVTLNLEVLNRFESHIINTAEEGVKLVKEINEDNVKVMLDTFHMNIEEVSMGGAIRTAGKLLGHLHTGECNRTPPGTGRIPWQEIRTALQDVGYDGNVVMEPFVGKGGQVGKDIHVWHDYFSDVSEKALDDAAYNALMFQRYTLDWNK